MMVTELPQGAPAPADTPPNKGDIPDTETERLYVASSTQLMWWKFRKHKLAMVSAVITIVFYFVAMFCEFVAPYEPQAKFAGYRMAPPSRIRILDDDGHLRAPFIYGLKQSRDPETLQVMYEVDTAVTFGVGLFVATEPYRLWGLIPLQTKLIGLRSAPDGMGLFLAGTDTLGRDLFSRVVFGARLSLSVGLIGVIVSMTLGILLGGISGYFGGVVDNAIQRTIELLRSIPDVPLWMALSAALPLDWPIVRVYFGITLILSLVSWTGMARVVRGRFLSLREDDFVLAARLAGANELRIIIIHMVPCFASHIIATMTLSIPGMILSETSLSFLGLGLREPAISWGVLLGDAQNVSAIALAPWKLWAPGIAVVAAVLAINFVGDGLRDAADPYAR